MWGNWGNGGNRGFGGNQYIKNIPCCRQASPERPEGEACNYIIPCVTVIFGIIFLSVRGKGKRMAEGLWGAVRHFFAWGWRGCVDAEGLWAATLRRQLGKRAGGLDDLGIR